MEAGIGKRYRRSGCYFFSTFQNTGTGEVTLPLMFLRVPIAPVYWPSTACVGTSAARSWIFSTSSLRLASSVSSAKAWRSRVISSSQGQPNHALSQLALMKL
jgi:hypothetical protein